ncbi:MAG: hypothetical protein ABIO44_11150 [Saprospiraceae bacterium]
MKNVIIISIQFIFAMNVLFAQDKDRIVLIRCMDSDSNIQKIFKNDYIVPNFISNKNGINSKVSSNMIYQITDISKDSLYLLRNNSTLVVARKTFNSITRLNASPYIEKKKRKGIGGLTIAGIILSALGLIGLAAANNPSDKVSDIGAEASGCLGVIISVPILVVGAILLLVGLSTENLNTKKFIKEGTEIKFNDPTCQCNYIINP